MTSKSGRNTQICGSMCRYAGLLPWYNCDEQTMIKCDTIAIAGESKPFDRSSFIYPQWLPSTGRSKTSFLKQLSCRPKKITKNIRHCRGGGLVIKNLHLFPQVFHGEIPLEPASSCFKKSKWSKEWRMQLFQRPFFRPLVLRPPRLLLQEDSNVPREDR